MVLSFYHEFTTTDGGQGQERIGLKVEEHEWAKLDSDNKRKSRIFTIVTSVSLVGITIVGLPAFWCLAEACQLTHLLATKLGPSSFPGAEQRSLSSYNHGNEMVGVAVGLDVHNNCVDPTPLTNLH